MKTNQDVDANTWRRGRLITMIQSLGHAVIGFAARTGRSLIFLLLAVTRIPLSLKKPSLITAQLYSVGVLSMQIIVISGLTVGMVLGLQMYNTLTDFGAEESLGPVVALSLVRELGPVLSALLFSGRAGSALTAEIGLMKATEQLSVMEMMAVDPIRRVIAPRLLAGIVSVPLLAAIFSAVGILGSYFIGVGLLGVDAGAFWSQMTAKVDFQEDIFNGFVKSLVFGVVATWIAVFEGYDSVPTTAGVSSATTRTVVHTAFAVLGLDFVLTALMFGEV